MIKVAQFSDLHFSGKNLDEAGRCFGFAVDQAIRRGVDAAVISATRRTMRSTCTARRSSASRARSGVSPTTARC